MSTIRVRSPRREEKEIQIRQISVEELREELRPFEEKYHLSSEEFYEKFKLGEIEDTKETVDWCLTYRFYLYAIGQSDYQIDQDPPSNHEPAS
jgi:hypothetical protein